MWNETNCTRCGFIHEACESFTNAGTRDAHHDENDVSVPSVHRTIETKRYSCRWGIVFVHLSYMQNYYHACAMGSFIIKAQRCSVSTATSTA
jgi:hypothetical protein